MSPSWQSPRSWSLNVAAMAASCSASSLLLANCALYLKTNVESNIPNKILVHLALCSSSPRTRQASCIISCQFMYFLSGTKFALRWQLYFSSMILSKTWRNIRFPKTWGDSLAFPKFGGIMTFHVPAHLWTLRIPSHRSCLGGTSTQVLDMHA